MKQSKISLTLIVISVIGLAFIVSGLFVISSASIIDFAGQSWDTEINNHHFAGSCSGSVSGGEIANLQIQVSGSSGGSGCEVTSITQKSINEFDEILVVFDSSQYAGFEMEGNAGIFLTDKTRFSTRDETDVMNKLLSYSDNTIGGKSSFSNFFALKYVGFRNNHDGTYSIMKGSGIGDLSVVNKIAVPNAPLFLGMKVGGGGGAGGDRATATMNAYNVIFRVSGFALCKANQYSVDLNKDGKLDFGECVDISVLELNHREEFEQSVNDRLLKLEQQNTQKIIDLEQQIISLQQQNADVTLLKQQLEQTQKILADIQAKDRNVIAAVEANEQFERPNFIIELINRFIAWIKNILS